MFFAAGMGKPLMGSPIRFDPFVRRRERPVFADIVVLWFGSRAEALPGFDAFGCLRSLRARSALDGVSWVQGG